MVNVTPSSAGDAAAAREPALALVLADELLAQVDDLHGGDAVRGGDQGLGCGAGCCWRHGLLLQGRENRSAGCAPRGRRTRGDGNAFSAEEQHRGRGYRRLPATANPPSGGGTARSTSRITECRRVRRLPAEDSVTHAAAPCRSACDPRRARRPRRALPLLLAGRAARSRGAVAPARGDPAAGRGRDARRPRAVGRVDAEEEGRRARAAGAPRAEERLHRRDRDRRTAAASPAGSRTASS